MKSVIPCIILIFSFLLSTGALILASKLEKFEAGWRPELSAVWGIVLGTALLVLYRFLIKSLGTRSFQISSSIRQITAAILLVVGIFTVSVICLHGEWMARTEITPGMIIDDLLYQVRPAYGEEVGFRFGLANLTFGFFGFYPALIAGAVPFGLIHIMNFATGHPVEWDYILGVSLGGLLLTAIFMNFNLMASVIAHYVWNFLALFFSKGFGLPQERLEGAPLSLAALALASAYLIWRYGNLHKSGSSAIGMSKS